MRSCSFSTNFKEINSPTRVTIYLYEILKKDQQEREDNLIDLYQDYQQEKKKPPMEIINIKLEDLMGAEEDFLMFKSTFNNNIVTTATANVMQTLDVNDYLAKCNQKHALLMQQVNDTRKRCQQLFYTHM